MALGGLFLALSVVIYLFPGFLVYPVTGLLIWTALAFLVRGWRIRRRKDE